MGDIAYQNKDIASKVTGETMVGKSLAAFGLPQLKVVDILPTNLPAIESNELRLDNLFLLSDGSVSIIDYESEYSRENFIKYLNYIARVMKRYTLQKKLEELSQIKVIVIYTADVEHADEVYDLGGLVMRVESVFLMKADTDKIESKLRQKIETEGSLDEEGVMQMMILPLTVKGKDEKQKYIIRIVELAKQISDPDQMLWALAGILTFSDKVIDEAYRKLIKEEMRMTQIERMIFEDGLEQGLEQGICALIQDNIEEGMSQDKVVEKLEKRFRLSSKDARNYYDRYKKG